MCIRDRGYIILDLAAVAYLHIVSYVNILPERTSCSNSSAFLNMAKVPDFCSLTDSYIVIYVRTFVYKEFAHPSNRPTKSMVAHCSNGSFTGLPSLADR